MSKFKDRLRNQQLKVERKKLYLSDLKKLRRRKLDERQSVKALLSALIERQANYEHYLKQAFDFITDVRDRQRCAKLEIYQSDKIMVELKMKINQVGSKLGLNEGDVDQKKLVEINRLNQKKLELEKKLESMADLLKKSAFEEKENSPSPAPAVVPPTPVVEKLPDKSFDELTIKGLPSLDIKLKMVDTLQPLARSRQE